MRRFLWNNLLRKQVVTINEYKQIWLLASGAANLLSMEQNRNYYSTLKESVQEYPNPGFN